MVESFRLKDGETITVNGKDVERIRILNDIVWEKRRQTFLTITTTPSLLEHNEETNKDETYVTIGKTFKITAILTDNHGELLDNQSIDFTGNGINGVKTVKTVNGVAELDNILPSLSEEMNGKTNKQIKEYPQSYTITFNGYGRYLPIQKEIIVRLEKEQPIVTALGNNVVYYGQYMKAKLTRSDGVTPIPNEELQLRFEDIIDYNKEHNTNEYSSATFYTDKNGIGEWQVNRGGINERVNYGTHNRVWFVFHEQDRTGKIHPIYQTATSEYRTYTIKKYATKTLDIARYKQYDDILNWEYKSADNLFEYTKINKNKSAPNLTIYFNTNNIDVLQRAAFTFKVNAISGYFPERIQAQLYIYRTGITTSIDTDDNISNLSPIPSRTTNGYTYSIHGPLSREAIWSDSDDTNYLIKDVNLIGVTINGFKNIGTEIGHIKIQDPQLKINYTPSE